MKAKLHLNPRKCGLTTVNLMFFFSSVQAKQLKTKTTVPFNKLANVRRNPYSIFHINCGREKNYKNKNNQHPFVYYAKLNIYFICIWARLQKKKN